MKQVHTEFLDTTIRDGGYAINFQFSISDVERIAESLEEAGIRYIEIGHGVGMNGSSTEQGKALHSDVEYMEAARRCLSRADYGMFCIPGIARLSDLELACEHGMQFVRIGTNITEVQQAQEYVETAKKLGLTVMTSLMKSYLVSPEEFGECAKKVESYGADAVYIVDSAGSMFPEDIKAYMEAVRSKTSLKLGFHGHNNLGMAVANTIAAYEEGADFVDTTMQGLGRSAGNAPAEAVIAALLKKGYEVDIDLLTLLMRSKALIHPLIHKRGVNPLDIICGYSEFHSSYMKSIHRLATTYNVNPLKLIMQYADLDKVRMDEKQLEAIARTMPQTSIASIDLDFWEYG